MSETSQSVPTVETTASAAELKVYPEINFHGEPIQPKDEPIDWDSLPVPDLNLPMPSKKRSVRKKAKPILVPAKVISKPQKPTVNKNDQLYICDIKEYSDIELYLDELDEVRGIFANNRLPERLTFRYKGGSERTWPFYRILEESYNVLVKVFSAMKKDFGFTKVAKSEILRKIIQIRQSWRDPNALKGY